MRSEWREFREDRGGSRLRSRACLILAVHCFLGLATANGQTVGPSWTFSGGQQNARLGFAVGSAGDVNGDGYGDVIVGAPGFSGRGAVALFYGSAGGLPQTPSWWGQSDQLDARFGFSVASAGDVNGDGFGDVVVGAPDYDDGQQDEGAAFLYLGSAAGLSTSPTIMWQAEEEAAHFGSAVAGAGDVDADGFDDVLIGAPQSDGGARDAGAAYLFLGGTTPSSVSAWTSECNQAGAAYGSSVAALGDLDGDGFSDVGIGAPLFDNGQLDEGQVRVYAGTSSGLDPNPLQTFEQNVAGSQFGFSVAGGGDLSGSGVRRILFGAPIYHYTHVEEGGTFLGALGQSVFFLDFGRQDFAHRGSSIASAGDVNADGLPDVVIGADRYDSGQEDEGVVSVHLGHPSFVVDRTPAWVVDGGQAFCAFGASVASAGDVNGDGFSDIVVGAPLHDGQETDEGRAFLFLGPSGAPVGVAESRSAVGSAIIRQASPNPFRAALRLAFAIPRAGRVHLSIIDIVGRRRMVLVDEERGAGSHTVTWNGRDHFEADCAPGVYFVRLAFAGDATVQRVLRVD